MICSSPPATPSGKANKERGSRRRANHMGDSAANAAAGRARKVWPVASHRQKCTETLDVLAESC
jgi:hypothetical protein